jgi:hypothetical protein
MEETMDFGPCVEFLPAPIFLAFILFITACKRKSVPAPLKDESAVDWNAMFSAFGNQYRRRLLVSLLEQNPQEDTVRVPEDFHEGEKSQAALQTAFVHRTSRNSKMMDTSNGTEVPIKS